MKLTHKICRLILGFTFVFSGLVKGVDPVGVSYKFIDYFNAWGMDFLVPFALPLGILLCIGEFGIGFSLILNSWRRLTSWKAFAFVVFFFFVTLIVAITNPVSDCGCFGDAVKLSNWGTFYKNAALLIVAIIVVFFRPKREVVHFKEQRSIGTIVAVIGFLFVVLHSYNHLPLVDFRPYHVGADINEGMKIPEDAPQDVYENTFVYKNKTTGRYTNFTEENYPWQDTLNWEYVEMSTKLIKKGYETPIKDFQIIEESTAEDVKDFFLLDEYFTFILVSRDINKVDWTELKDRLNEVVNYCDENEYFFIGLTASSISEAEKTLSRKGVSFFRFYNTDETVLKTIIRSNPGLLLMKKGVIIDKWHYNDIPSEEELGKITINN